MLVNSYLIGASLFSQFVKYLDALESLSTAAPFPGMIHLDPPNHLSMLFTPRNDAVGKLDWMIYQARCMLPLNINRLPVTHRLANRKHRQRP